MSKVFTPDDWFKEAAIRCVAAGEDIALEQLKTAYKEKDDTPYKFDPKPIIILSLLALKHFRALSMEETLNKGELVNSEAKSSLNTFLLAAKQEIALEQEGFSGGGRVMNLTKTVKELVNHPIVETIVKSIDKVKHHKQEVA